MTEIALVASHFAVLVVGVVIGGRLATWGTKVRLRQAIERLRLNLDDTQKKDVLR